MRQHKLSVQNASSPEREGEVATEARHLNEVRQACLVS